MSNRRQDQKPAVTRPYSFSRASKQLLVEIKVEFLAPCKMDSRILPESRQDSRHSPGSRRDLAEVARFPGGILPGKNSRRVSR